MSVRIACPGCGREARVEELSLGRQGRCPRCGHVFALALPGGGSGSGSAPATPASASAWKGEAAPGPASAADLPEQFGRYRIMRRLGQGGMGAVYLAQDVRLGRSVALKVPFFHPTEGAGAIARFEREARAAATLDHPNLCPVYDVGEIDGVHYLTMPFLEGRPLSEAMPRGRIIPEAQAAVVVRKLALALAEAHAKGVIHRDLKPGNIMINRRRELVIMDFGLARLAGADTPLTASGHVLGTALYMAPEQAAGDVEATGPPCDVYSLGVILYELLTGVRPFEGPWALVIGLKSVRDPEPPSVHRPGLDPRLDAICRKAVARAPADRYQTMAEFAADLGEFHANAATIFTNSAPTNQTMRDDAPGGLAESTLAGLIRFGASTVAGEPDLSLRPHRSRPTQPARSPHRWRIIVVGFAALAFVIAAWRARPQVMPPGSVAAATDPRGLAGVPPPTKGVEEIEPPAPADLTAVPGPRPEANPAVGSVPDQPVLEVAVAAPGGPPGPGPAPAPARGNEARRIAIEARPEPKPAPPVVDLLQPGTTWKGPRHHDDAPNSKDVQISMKVLDRKGAVFKASVNRTGPLGRFTFNVVGEIDGARIQFTESGEKLYRIEASGRIEDGVIKYIFDGNSVEGHRRYGEGQLTRR